MVKAALKTAPATARALQRSLTARQLGLKLIANVTYGAAPSHPHRLVIAWLTCAATGYTAANFSGRMPLVELADAIVSSGRATLERAISMVNNHPEWQATVRAPLMRAPTKRA